MSQPYIFKKQVLSIIIGFFIILLLIILRFNQNYIKALLFYEILMFGVTFIPSFRKRLSYPLLIHIIIYYIPFYLPLLFYAFRFEVSESWWSVLIGFLLGIVLLFSNWKHNKKFIEKNIMSKVPIKIQEFRQEMMGYIFALFGEELFFRMFLITFLEKHLKEFSVIGSAVLFLHVHYINRWSNVMFNTRSYIYHFITGVVFGLLFYYTHSLIGCIIAHIVFNCPQYILLVRRLKISQGTSEQMFNDY